MMEWLRRSHCNSIVFAARATRTARRLYGLWCYIRIELISKLKDIFNIQDIPLRNACQLTEYGTNTSPYKNNIVSTYFTTNKNLFIFRSHFISIVWVFAFCFCHFPSTIDRRSCHFPLCCCCFHFRFSQFTDILHMHHACEWPVCIFMCI